MMIPLAKHSRHTVLIVDDDPEILEVLSDLLIRDGFDVVTAEDGRRACELLKDILPCMLLADVMMPGMDGFELCRRVKQTPETAHVPVALITARVQHEDVVLGIEAGAVDYIRKPFDRDEVRMRVRTQIRLHEALIAQQRLDKHLAVISAAAKDAILMMDGDGRITHFNQAAETMFGYALDQVLGRNLHALLAPKRFHAAHLAAFELFQQSGKGAAVDRTVELQALKSSGEEFPIELSLASTSVDGSWCAVGIVRDITQRKRADQDLLHAKEEWERTFDAVPDLIAVLDKDYRVLRANRAMADRMHRSAHELTGARCYEAVHGLDRPPALCPHARLVLSGKEERAEVVENRLAGTFDVSTTPLLDRDGELIGSVHVARDISATKRAEEKLRLSEERYRALFESSRDAIMTLEPPAWSFTSGNPATLAVFRAESQEQFRGCGPGDVSPEYQPDGRPSALAAGELIGKAMAEGSAEFEWTHKRLDGELFPATVLLTRMEHAGKDFLQATVRDITAAKQAEAEIAHARKLETVGQLAAGIAHEINTPTQYVGDCVHFLKEAFESLALLSSDYRQAVDQLQALGGNDSLVAGVRDRESEVDLPYLMENVPHSLDLCIDGVARISKIVRAMKEFAHPDQREKVGADLNQALQSTLTIAHNEYKYVAEVETDFGDLPTVVCHVGDLNQVFLNLIVNAAHAIGDVVGNTEGKGVIRIATREEGDWVRIDIADSGAGIPEAIRHRIFDPFFTTKQVGKGSGQGLAIARSIVVTKHFGTLTFRTETGRGTTFSIRLPVHGKAPADGEVTA